MYENKIERLAKTDDDQEMARWLVQQLGFIEGRYGSDDYDDLAQTFADIIIPMDGSTPAQEEMLKLAYEQLAL